MERVLKFILNSCPLGLTLFVFVLNLFYNLEFIPKKLITMKKFMLIFMGPPYESLGFSPEEMQGRMMKWKEWTGEIIEKGIFVDGQGLLDNAKTLRGSKDAIFDGPYADTKETVGGYYVINANSIDEAVEVAKDFPDFDLGGGVEVRECMPDQDE